MQKEREAKRKQEQLRKEAEAQARLLVLKVNFCRSRKRNEFEEIFCRFQEERERTLKAKQEEEMIERHVIEIRKEMNEKRLQDEENRKQFVLFLTICFVFHHFVFVFKSTRIWKR